MAKLAIERPWLALAGPFLSIPTGLEGAIVMGDYGAAP